MQWDLITVVVTVEQFVLMNVIFWIFVYLATLTQNLKCKSLFYFLLLLIFTLSILFKHCKIKLHYLGLF